MSARAVTSARPCRGWPVWPSRSWRSAWRGCSGPLFSPPAANAWLLSSPVDRGALLRPGWRRTAALTVALAGLVLLAPAVLGGFSSRRARCSWLPEARPRSPASASPRCRRSARQAVTLAQWAITATLWSALGLAATRGAGAVPGVPFAAALAVTGLAVLVAYALFRRSRLELARVPRRVLGYTEHLSPSLSGALSSVDLGLMYDVLLARRWGPAARVRTRTGGPLGWWALVHRDLLRAARTPQPFVLLAGLVLVPYAAAGAGAGRAVVLVTTLLGLLGGPAMCAGLRVVVRTQSLARMLPLRRQSLLLAHLVVPGTALLLFALASTWTLLPTGLAGEAVNLASRAGCPRWPRRCGG